MRVPPLTLFQKERSLWFYVWVMLQLLIMLIPAYLQIGLCLSCVSPAVNKDIFGIIAIFEGRLYSSVLLGALPGLDPGPLGSVWGALMVGGRAQSPGCVLAGASSPSPRPPTCERSLHGRELSPCFLEKILKCLSKGLIMGLGTNSFYGGLRSLNFPLIHSRRLRTLPLRLGILTIPRKPVLLYLKLRNASSLSSQNGTQMMGLKQIIVFLI